MKIDAANEAEILAGVVWWANARGWYDDGKPHRQGGTPWLVYMRSAGDVLLLERLKVCQPASEQLQAHYVSPTLALAWAIIVETEPEPVDVGRCPACVERGGTMEWHRVVRSSMADAHFRITASVGPPWEVAAHRWWNPDISHGVASRPCPACSGTGRETVPLARLLLDAAADKTAQALLSAHADQLCADGWLLGELLSVALCWMNNTLQVDVCSDGTKSVSYMHTLDVLRWLEWLAWCRQRPLNDVYRVQVDGFTYEFASDSNAVPTAQVLTDAFNEQGGPATFAVDDDNVVRVSFVDSWYVQELDEPRSRKHGRSQHARHIGDRLGRRLGVRR